MLTSKNYAIAEFGLYGLLEDEKVIEVTTRWADEESVQVSITVEGTMPGKHHWPDPDWIIPTNWGTEYSWNGNLTRFDFLYLLETHREKYSPPSAAWTKVPISESP